MMQQSHKMVFVLLTLSSLSYAADDSAAASPGPMNSDWFSDTSGTYAKANQALQQCQWERAERLYSDGLAQESGSNYDQDMARINLASARFAQGNESDGWKVFDRLVRSEPYRLETERGIFGWLRGRRIVVTTDQVGIGDIFHFLKAVKRLREQTGAKVTLAVKGFLRKALEGPARAYDFDTANVAEVNTEEFSTSTHIVSLLGHLRMQPSELSPQKVVLTADEQAVGKVRAVVDPQIAAGKKVAVVFIGEDREAIVMGGKKLRRRHLDAAALEKLLREHPEVMLIDCNPKQSRIAFEGQAGHRRMEREFEGRVVELPDEDSAFDTTIALGLVANQLGDKYCAFAADNGPTNVFGRALCQDAQKRTVVVIPDGSSYDMRMEGLGTEYEQGLSHCRVRPCAVPADQEEVILGAYEDMN